MQPTPNSRIWNVGSRDMLLKRLFIAFFCLVLGCFVFAGNAAAIVQLTIYIQDGGANVNTVKVVDVGKGMEVPYNTFVSNPAGGHYVYEVGDFANVETTGLPASGYVFDQWMVGHNSPDNPTTFNVGSGTTVEAHFALIPTYDLVVDVKDQPDYCSATVEAPPGNVLTPNGAKSSPPAVHVYDVPDGVTVQITANDGDTGTKVFLFQNWAQDLAGSTNPETFVMPAAPFNVDVHFTEGRILTIDKTGSGNGTVTATSGLVHGSGGGTVAAFPGDIWYIKDETGIEVSVAPDADSFFRRWSGYIESADLTSNPARLQGKMGKHATVTVGLGAVYEASFSGDSSGDEASGIDFTINLSRAVELPDAPLDVCFSVAASGAEPVESGDLTSGFGNICTTIDAGLASKTVTVSAVDDGVVEPDETFEVSLLSNTKVRPAAAGATATGTVVNTQNYIVSIDDQESIAEGDSTDTTVNFTVQLDNAGDVAVTVPYTIDLTETPAAASGADFTVSAGPVNIPAGSPSVTIPVTIKADTIPEGNEVFRIVLGAPVGPATLHSTDNEGRGVILNDDDAVLSIDDHTSIVEGDSGTTTVDFTVSLDKASEAYISVDYSVVPGTAANPEDFEALSGTADFTAGNQTFSIPVTIKGDTAVEADETFTISLTAGTVVGPAVISTTENVGDGVIVDANDKYTITIGSALGVTEGASGDTNTADFTVTLVGTGDVAVDVPYALGPDATYPATIGVDVDALPGPPAPTVSLTGGGATNTISITVNGDDEVEYIEKFLVTLDISGLPIDPTGSDLEGLGTIANDDDYTITIDDVTVAVEGDSATTAAQFTVELSGLGSVPVDVVYDLLAGDTHPVILGTDVVDLPALPIPFITLNGAGATETINIDVNGDLRVEYDEEFKVQLDLTGLPIATAGSDVEGVGTITDDDHYTISVTGDGSVVEPDTAATVDHTFNVDLVGAGDLPVSVNYSVVAGPVPAATIAAGADVEPNSSTLNFTGGDATQTVTVTINGDTAVELDENFRLDLQTITGPVDVAGSDTVGDGTITDNDNYVISINDLPSITEGDSGTSTATFTVSLDQAGQQDVEVAYTIAGDTATEGVDFDAADGSVTILAGDTEAAIDVTIYGDTRVEVDETFNITLGTITGPGVLSATDNVGTGTIPNTDRYTLSIADNNSINESTGVDTIGQLTVSLNEAGDLPVTVAYSATGVTATEGTDFDLADGTLTIAANNTTATLDVTIYGDTRVEDSETFTVSLGTVTGQGDVSATAGTATGTILDDDAYTISIAPQPNITEGDAGTSTVQFTVTLDQAGDLPVSVAYTVDGDTATEGVDFSAADDTLNFAATQTSQTLDVTINGDTIVETDEIFFITLGTITGPGVWSTTNKVAEGTIKNDDEYTISIADLTTITEGDAGTSTAAFTVSLDQAGEDGVTVAYSVAGVSADEGTDFDAADGVLTFAASDTSKTIDVTIYGDNLVEIDETFEITLGTVTGSGVLSATDAVGTGTIVNDDDYTISIGNLPNIVENDSGTTTAQFSVVVDQVGDQPVSVDYSAAGVTATAGTDFSLTPGTATINAGATGTTIDVTINGDLTVEDDETFEVTLGAISSGPGVVSTTAGVGVGTILNDDEYVVSIDDESDITEGSSGAWTTPFTVRLDSAGEADVTVAYSATGVTAVKGTDFDCPDNTITITAGDTSATFNVGIMGDTIVEGDETFDVALGAVTGPGTVSATDGVGTGTIKNDDFYSISIADVANITEGDAGSTTQSFTVSLDQAGEVDVTVDYTVADGTAVNGVDYSAAAGSVTVLAGDTTATIDVTIIGDTDIEQNETFDVILGLVTGTGVVVDGTGTGTIVNDDSYSVSIADEPNIPEGDSGTTQAPFTVSLDQVGEQDLTVFYSIFASSATDGVDFNTGTGSILIAAGATSGTIEVDIIGDTVVEADETFTVRLDSITGPGIIPTLAEGQATGTIVNDDAFEISIDNVTVTETAGAKAAFTVSLDQAGDIDVSVDFATGDAGDTATAGADYVSATGTATIFAGSTSTTVEIDVLDDGLYELDETFTAALTTINLAPGAFATGKDKGVATIVDDGDTYHITLVESLQTVTEGTDASVSFTVTLDQALPADISVPFAVNDGTAKVNNDYGIPVTTVSPLAFSAGETSKQITIDILDDDLYEALENFTVTISDPAYGHHTIGTGSADCEINDEATDTYQATLSGGTTVDENVGTVSLSVNLDQPVPGGATIGITLAGTADQGAGLDYTVTPDTLVLVFSDTETSKTIDLAINDDSLMELTETIEVGLTADTHRTVAGSPQTVSILNGDTFAFTLSGPVEVDETAGTATFNITLDQMVPGGVSFALTAAGSGANPATAGVDFSLGAGTVSFTAAETTKPVTINLTDDSLIESPETFDLTAETTNPFALPNLQAVTCSITSDDGYRISITDVVTVNEADGFAIFTVTVNPKVDEDQSVKMDYTTVDGTAKAGVDYTTKTGTLTFWEDQKTKTIAVPIIDNNIDPATSPVSFTLQLSNNTSNPAGGSFFYNNSGRCDITDNDVTVTFSIVGNGQVNSEKPHIQVIPIGSDTTVAVAEPDPNHFLWSWSGDFTGDYTVTSTQFTNVTTNKTVTVTFKEKPKVNTIVEPDPDLHDVFHGEISPGGSGDHWVHMDYLTDNTFTIAPENGFCIGNVSVDGTPLGQITEHTFYAVDRLSPDKYTIYATFRDRFTLTGQVDPQNARSGSGGSGTWRVYDAATDGTVFDSGWLTSNELVEIPCDIYQVKVAFSDQTGWQTPATKTLTLTEDYTVVGWYRPILTVVSSDGQVTSSDNLIDCPTGADCEEIYDYNTKVTLTAAADAGSVFANWDGDLAGSSPIATFFMDKPRTITALYETQTTNNMDADGDGWSINDGDCNDGDDTIYPTAKELCDGTDHDCDDLTNLTDPIDPDCEDAELGLANLPLDTLLQPAPATIMFVMDDSGSMDFEFSNPVGVTEDWSEKHYMWDDDKPGQDNTYKDSWRYLAKNDRGYWRTQWAHHNRLYYNPNVEYLPWKKDDGSRWNNADQDSSGNSIWPTAYQDPNKHHNDYKINLTDVFWTLGDSSGGSTDFDTDAVIIDSHKASPGTFTLDDPNRWREDSWHSEGYDNNFYDTAISGNANNGTTRRATWTPSALPEGYYNVYAWWRDIGNYATSVKYKIYHKTGPSGSLTTTDIHVNQEQNSKRWNRLGNNAVWIDASTNPKVVLEHYVTNGGNHACADAVAFYRVGGAADPNVYNAHYYVTINQKKLDGLGNEIHDGEGNIVYETDANGVPIPESIYLVNLDTADTNNGVKYYKVTVNSDQFVTGLDYISDPALVPAEVKVPVREHIYDYADPASPTATELWEAERRNFANWYTYYRRRELTAKAAVGEVISGLRGVRVGFKYINGKGDSNDNVWPKPVRVTTLDLDTGEEVMENYDNLLADFYDFNSDGGTPLRRGLDDVAEFFDQNDNSTGGIGSDKNGPWYMPDSNGKSRGGECQQAFAIVFTDGFYNGGDPDGIANEDGDNLTPIDTSPLAGHGNYLFADNWSDTLADIAMKYYETDLCPTLADEVPPSEKDFDTAEHQHMVTYTVSFGVKGSLDPDEYDLYNDSPDLVKYPEWPKPFDANAYRIDDMWHAAVNGRGQYLSAENPEQLVDSMTKIMDNMLSRIGSGSSLSINGEKLHTGTVMYQASYSTDGWEGDVKAFTVDHVTGMVDTGTPLWSANTELNKVDWDEREIATYKPGTGGVPFMWTDLSTDQQNLLRDNPNLSGLQDQGEASGIERLKFLRGNHADEKKFSGGWLRNRNSKLGDIVHSAPFYVDYVREVDDGFGNITYENFGVLFAAANDGMLHGFRSTDGKELFAYVPNLVFDSLGSLTLPEPYFRHRYYLDLTPHIRDVGYKHSTLGFVSQKLLVGGLGKGGKGYYGLDVTDPENMTEANADQWVMWEFPNTGTPAAAVDDLGFSFSEAYIVKSNIPTTNPDDKWKWVVVFGNGYASTTETAALYIVDAKTGALIKEIDTGATGGNGMSSPTPIDVNGDYRVDYVYAGDLQGNVWKFDLTSDDPVNWNSSYLDPSTSDPVPLFTAWGRTKEADGSYKADTNAEDYWRQPITTKISVIRHCEATQPGYMVLFGTGKNLATTDLEDTRYQTIYGIWDYGTSTEHAVGTFYRGASQELGNLATTATLLEQTVVYEDDLVRVLTDHKPTWVLDASDDKPTANAGWFFDLPISKERIIKSAQVRDGKLIIISSIPETDPCSAGGDSVVHEMDACSGSRLDNAQFDINNDGVIDENDFIVQEVPDPDDPSKTVKIYLAPTGMKFDAMIHPPIILETPGGETERKYFSTSAGNISTMEERTETQGMFFWRMIER